MFIYKKNLNQFEAGEMDGAFSYGNIAGASVGQG